MGTGGYAIPSICEPDVIEFVKCEADFVPHVEKDTVWSRFNEDRFWEKHNCILTEGSANHLVAFVDFFSDRMPNLGCRSFVFWIVTLGGITSTA